MVLGWLNRKIETKLRLSQTKMLYQNQKAVTYLLDYFSPMIEAGIPGADTSLGALNDAAILTESAILTLTYEPTLDERQSQELAMVNNMLKTFYAQITEARTALEKLGGTQKRMPPFAERFKPERGWDAFSDREWDELVSWAADGAGRSIEEP